MAPGAVLLCAPLARPVDSGLVSPSAAGAREGLLPRNSSSGSRRRGSDASESTAVSAKSQPSAVIAGVLVEFPPGRFARRRRRRFLLRGPHLEARGLDQSTNSEPQDVYNLSLAQMGKREGLQFSIVGPHLPSNTLELAAPDEHTLYRWHAALSRQLQLPCCAGAVYAVRKHEAISDRCRDHCDGVAVPRRTSGKLAGTLDTAHELDESAGSSAAPPPAAKTPRGAARRSAGSRSVECTFCGFVYSDHDVCPMCGEARPEGSWSDPEDAEPAPTPSNGRGGSPRGAVAEDGVVVVHKQPDEAMGIAWEEHTRVAWVVGGSPAERAGVDRYVGCHVTHVNSQPVSRLRHIKRQSDGCSQVHLRFEEAQKGREATIDRMTDLTGCWDDASELPPRPAETPPSAAAAPPPAPPPAPDTPGAAAGCLVVPHLAEAPGETAFTTAKGGTVVVRPPADGCGGLRVYYKGEPDPVCKTATAEVDRGRIELFLGPRFEAAPFRLPPETAPRILAQVRAMATAHGVECDIPDTIPLTCRSPGTFSSSQLSSADAPPNCTPGGTYLCPSLMGTAAADSTRSSAGPTDSAGAGPPRPPRPPADQPQPWGTPPAQQSAFGRDCSPAESEGPLTVSAESERSPNQLTPSPDGSPDTGVAALHGPVGGSLYHAPVAASGAGRAAPLGAAPGCHGALLSPAGSANNAPPILTLAKHPRAAGDSGSHGIQSGSPGLLSCVAPLNLSIDGSTQAEDEARMKVMGLNSGEMLRAIREAGGVDEWKKLGWPRRWAIHQEAAAAADEPALRFADDAPVRVRHGPKWEGSTRSTAGEALADPTECVLSEDVLGQRVCRNPRDWEYGDQDGGEGMLGTVVLVGKEEVTVRWDAGRSHIYRWGFGGKWDVVIVDEKTATAGVPITTREQELQRSLEDAQRRAEELERRCDARSDFAATLIQERDEERRRAEEAELKAQEARRKVRELQLADDVMVM
eukprot:TRINITY_DN25626_c0_g1_i1.p1 TRINITY_DN25626_c0_g1~~TRINITY_DN25626_c0_g1_i1.p1  ORF type:complete len:1002 (+),score=239.46 TRINITY_DN25626_c0_g1_i1:90-3008(+)